MEIEWRWRAWLLFVGAQEQGNEEWGGVELRE